MDRTGAFAFLVVTAHGMLVHGAALYTSRPANVQAPGPAYRQMQMAPAQQQSNNVLPKTPNAARNLESDLENIRAAHKGKVNQPHADSGVGRNVESLVEGTRENDLDLELLYDLVRAVEYEANAQLFDKVLQDLDSANYQVPMEIEHMRGPQSAQVKDELPLPVHNAGPKPIVISNQGEPRMGEMMQVQNAVGTMGHPDGEFRKPNTGDDNMGHVTAQEVPNPPHIPLHKRLSAALRDLPRDDSVLPMDGLADKRNMFKKETA